MTLSEYYNQLATLISNCEDETFSPVTTKRKIDALNAEAEDSKLGVLVTLTVAQLETAAAQVQNDHYYNSDDDYDSSSY